MITKNKVLDEAARSVRRTFVGSIIGTAVMFGVISVAGAFGLPEAPTKGELKTTISQWRAELASWRKDMVQRLDRIIITAGQKAPAAPAAVQQPKETSPVPAEPPARIMLASSEQVLPFVAPTPEEQNNESASPPMPAMDAPPAAAWPEIPKEPIAPQPIQELKPVETPRPLEAVKPVEAAKPIETAKPIEATKPVEAAQPAVPLPAPDVALIQEAMQAPVQVAVPLPVPAPLQARAHALEPVQDLLREDAQADTPRLVRVPMPLPKPPLTPAQQLDLHGPELAKAEKCLAQAVYFEARNQAVRGQMAVAQVVMNRVFSPYYPKDVCGVVYQNAHRRLSCQFTFACDGKPESINERGAWARAQRIAKQTLDAKIWLPDVAKSTHYHAGYVRPYWIRDMKTMVRHGTHIFYRPRNWGDGANELGWGGGAAKKGQSS